MVQTARKRLIEEYFPAQQLSPQARREKKGHPPTYQMHYWWSRKPLIIARAAALASLLPASTDLNVFHDLLGFNNGAPPYTRQYTAAERASLLSASNEVGGQGLVIDPFSGGGSIPFEVLRAGFPCVTSDLNPVAWLIQKVTLEFPRCFGIDFVEPLEKYARQVIARVAARLERLYPRVDGKIPIAYLYAWQVSCPSCGTQVPLVNSWKLVSKPQLKSGKQGKLAFLRPSYNPTKKHVDLKIETRGVIPKGNCVRARGCCLNPDCNCVISNDWIRKQINLHPQERLIAVVTNGQEGKEYHLASEDQIAAIGQAESSWRAEESSYRDLDAVPHERIPSDPRATTIHLYLQTWDQVANPRQRLVLAELVLAIRAITQDAINSLGPEQGKAIALYLACLLGKHLNRNCRITTWDVQGEKIVHACSNKLNALQWNHAEINPFASVSGSLEYSLQDLLNGYRFAAGALGVDHTFNLPPLVLANTPVSNLRSLVKSPVTCIITDPPYYDDAPYGEISEFFFSWESRAVGAFIAEDNPLYASHTTPKDEDISVSRARDSNHFREGFAAACQDFYQILSNDGLLVLFFVHSGWDAWQGVLTALNQANFRITATWPVHTESLGITNTGKTASLSSLLIVARKVTPKETQSMKSARSEPMNLIIQNLTKKLPQFWAMGFRGLDLIAGATGIALEALSNCTSSPRILEEPLPFSVPELVRKLVIDFVLIQQGVNPSEVDALSKFYYYFVGNEMRDVPLAYGEIIAETLGCTLPLLYDSGLISKPMVAGKKLQSLKITGNLSAINKGQGLKS